MPPERGRQVRRDGLAAGEEQHAARILVQAVDEARALRRAKTQGVEQPIEMARGARAALDREPRRLVDGDHIRVAMDHAGLDPGFVAGRYSRPRGGRRSLRQGRHTDALATLEPVVRLGALAIDPDLALAQKPLQPAVGEPGEAPPKPAVEPEPGFTGIDIVGGDAAHLPLPQLSAPLGRRSRSFRQ